MLHDLPSCATCERTSNPTPSVCYFVSRQPVGGRKRSEVSEVRPEGKVGLMPLKSGDDVEGIATEQQQPGQVPVVR